MSSDFSRFTEPPRPYEGLVPRPKHKNLLLDLDSTLVYTYVFRPRGFTDDPERWLVNIFDEPSGTKAEYYTLIRPSAKEFVARCVEHYNVFFFTAADRQYAEPVFEQLFPQIPAKQRFYRDACVEGAPDVFMKNIESLGFDPRYTVLLDDNAPQNTIPESNGLYCCQFGPKDDEEDGSPETIDELMQDQALTQYGDLLCSETFLNSDDVREQLAVFARLMDTHL